MKITRDQLRTIMNGLDALRNKVKSSSSVYRDVDILWDEMYDEFFSIPGATPPTQNYEIKESNNV